MPVTGTKRKTIDKNLKPFHRERKAWQPVYSRPLNKHVEVIPTVVGQRAHGKVDLVKIDLVLPSNAFQEKRNQPASSMKIYEKNLKAPRNSDKFSYGKLQHKSSHYHMV